MIFFHRTLTSFHIAALGITLLLGMIFLQGVFFYKQKHQADEAREWVAHTYEVLAAIRTPFAKIKDAQIAQRGYVLTGNKKFLDPYYAAIGDVRVGDKKKTMGYLDTNVFDVNIAELRELIKDNPDQQESLDRLEVLLKKEMKFIDDSLAAYERNPQEAIDMIRSGRGNAMMDEVRAIVTEMMKREQTFLTERLANDEIVENQFTWYIITAALFTYGGLLAAILLITRYFSRLRRVERELQAKENYFRAAAEGGTDAFFIFNAVRDTRDNTENLLLQYMNSVAARMLDISAHTLIGKNLEEVLTYSIGTHAEMRLSYLGVLHSNCVREAEYCVASGFKAGRCYQEQVIPFPDGIAVTCRDITDRKAVERMKNEFVSTVSHELRTPLTSIRGSLGLVLGDTETNLSGDTKELLTIAYNNCERLVRLINDILDIEKIESGKMTFDCRPLTLIPLVRQAIDANRSFADKYSVRLVLEREGECTVSENMQVMADADRLMQVLTNLLSNAIKFSPQGATVDICCHEKDDKIHIAVKDHGNGIPDEFRNYIFQKFAQADSSDTRQKGGTGLGLSIVKAIIEEMNGEIGFESEAGKGTIFHFTLPIAKRQAICPSSVTTIPEATCPRILVCEDEADISNLLRLILERAGFAVDVAGDAHSAYTLLEKNTYVAMTLDLMLPDKNGVTCIRELRAEPRFMNLPIIVVSAKAEEGRKQLNGDAINIIDWMHKPIDVQKLVHLVQHLHLSRHARILHVEDDTDITDVLRLALNKVADVICAPSLHKARSLLNSQVFDLVVLDIGLPDGKGTDLLPLLGSEGKHPTPVVLFTAAEVSQEISARVSASLTKSLTSEDKLLETIRNLIASGKTLPQQKEKRA